MFTKQIENSSKISDSSVLRAKRGELELLNTFGARG